MNWNGFTSIVNGTRIFNHGYDQCVALANLYNESVIRGSFVGVPSAYMWWTNYNNLPALRNNYTQSSRPVAGAIFVARNGIYNAQHGHIGVVTSVNSNGTFNTMEQNAGTWRYTGRYVRSLSNVLGFLIPRKNPAITPTPGGKTKVKHYHVEDAKSKQGGRSLVKGAGFYLHTNASAPTSKAVNVVGGVGYYSLTAHVYAEGTPGDIVEIYYMWQTDPRGKPVNSNHYVQRFTIPRDGVLREHVEFKRYVGGSKPVAVYLRGGAAPTNTDSVKITRFDSDAYLYI